MAAWATDDDSARERIGKALKATGLWAYEAGSGFPTIGNWYNGPIKPGMRFLWNPDASEERCRVTRISTGADEPMVWVVSLDRPGIGEVYNEENCFRSKAVPIGRK